MIIMVIIIIIIIITLILIVFITNIVIIIIIIIVNKYYITQVLLVSNSLNYAVQHWVSQIMLHSLRHFTPFSSQTFHYSISLNVIRSDDSSCLLMNSISARYCTCVCVYLYV